MIPVGHKVKKKIWREEEENPGNGYTFSSRQLSLYELGID